MNGRRWKPTVLISLMVFALAGLMFTVAATASQGTDLRADRATELRDLVRQRADRVQVQQTRVAQLTAEVDEATSGRSEDPEATRVADRIERLSAEAGLSEVQGKGIRVILDDAPQRDPGDPFWQTVTANDVVVHQADLEAVVNALWRGGAQGVEVMDQRIIGTSAIKCVGNTLLLHGRLYSPPYSLTAVGPVKEMKRSLREDPSLQAYRDWARVVGLGYSVETLKTTLLPAYEGPIQPIHATPAPAASDPAVPAITPVPGE